MLSARQCCTQHDNFGPSLAYNGDDTEQQATKKNLYATILYSHVGRYRRIYSVARLLRGLATIWLIASQFVIISMAITHVNEILLFHQILLFHHIYGISHQLVMLSTSGSEPCDYQYTMLLRLTCCHMIWRDKLR